MEFYNPRKIIFKAWNKESRLLVRLDSISCKKGELVKKDHILLQYTGHTDKKDQELYEMDVVLIGSSKFLIHWSSERSGWSFGLFRKDSIGDILTKETAQTMVRLCSYFESEGV